MRPLKRLQLFLRPQKIETTFGGELLEVEKILAEAPGMKELYEHVLQELSDGKRATGAGTTGFGWWFRLSCQSRTGKTKTRARNHFL